MKTVMALIHACAALAFVSTVTNTVDARPMHAGINYARYLQEADAIASELDDWMSKFEGDAEANGWLPQTESRSADEIYEDRKQRFFLAKDLVGKLQEENPEAKFTTDSPFTLLTEDEFSTYVQNSYLAGEAEGRKLRHNRPEYANEGDANQGQSNGRAQAYDFQSMFRKFFEDAWKKSNGANEGSEIANEAGAGNFGASYSFQDLIDWFNNNNQPGGNGNRPSRQPSNRPRPVPVNPPPASVPTYAPPSRRPTNAPPASIPTSAPMPRPSSNPLPVAPTSAPRPNPVGPVAPSEAPGGAAPAPAPTGESASDGNGGINWSTHKCMAPVQNQGQCGSCWAFATVSSTETGKCIASGGALTKLSEQNVASCDRRNSGCNGGALVYAMDYIKTNNVCTAAADPYTSGNGRLADCNSGCQKVQLGLKSTTRLSGESGLINALKKAPVTIAVAAGNSAWKQYAGGVLSTCQTTRVDHAVVAVGYDASSVIIRNSWGARWGEDGYMRMKLGAGGSGTCNMYADMSQPVF